MAATPYYAHGTPAGSPHAYAGPGPYAGAPPAGPPAHVMRMHQPPREWKVELHTTCCEAPSTFCYACCCPCCMAYQQRVKLLAFTGEAYSCCQKDSLPRPKGCFGEAYIPPATQPPAQWPPIAGQEPEVLREFQVQLCMEVVCCLGCAIAGTRELMKYKFNVQDSTCDQCTICCSVICCLLNRDSDSRDTGFATLMGCLNTQQEIEFKLEESKRCSLPHAGPPPQTMGSPVMQQSPHYGAMPPGGYLAGQAYQPPPQQQQQQQQQHYAHPPADQVSQSSPQAYGQAHGQHAYAPPHGQQAYAPEGYPAAQQQQQQQQPHAYQTNMH